MQHEGGLCIEPSLSKTAKYNNVTYILAFDAARAALSHVDLAASGLVQPISTASQIASSIEHKNALIRTFQKE